MSTPTFPPTPTRAPGPLPLPLAVVRLVPPETVAEDAIAARAYEKFVARGSAHGHDQEDWAAAKKELTTETLRSKS